MIFIITALDLLNCAMTKTYLEDLSRIITPDTQLRFNKKRWIAFRYRFWEFIR